TIARDFPEADIDGARDPAFPWGPWFSRSGNADSANRGRRRGGATVQHTAQSARPRSLSAHRARALSETLVGWRVHQGFRTEPKFPERRDFAKTQSRVHHARDLPGLRRLRANGQPDGGNDFRFGRKNLRLAPSRASRCGGESNAHD